MSFLTRTTGIFPRIPVILKTHPKKSLAAGVLVALLIFGLWWITRPKAPEYITVSAAKGDLIQTVEAVGTVVSERQLELKFSAAGIVARVLVKEGDRVRAGQRLAELKSGGLGANIASQRAALDSAQADLRTLEEGSRPEDIAIAEADLENKQAALLAAEQSLTSAEENLMLSQQQLDIIRQEASVSLAGQVSTSLSSINEELTASENALSTVDDVLSRSDVQDAISKDQPAALNGVRAQQRSAQDAISAARRKAALVGDDYRATLEALRAAQSAAVTSGNVLDTLFILISSLRETSYFTSSSRESLKASIATDRSTIDGAAGNLSASLSSLQNASAGYDTKIGSAEASVVSYTGTRDKAQSDIATYRSTIRSAQAALDLKRAGARPGELDAARARVRQQQALLARAHAEFADTVLTAPVSGIVTHVNIRIGESLPVGAAVTLLGESPYRIEMFVSEIDIPKVQLTQSGSVELDAFRGTHFALRVGDVDPSATIKDGVPKYRVRLDFVYPHTDLKIGMTGDAAITTGIRKDVVHVPARAVLEDSTGRPMVRVLQENGKVEERVVTVGMEGAAGDSEVTGIGSGETIIVLEKK
ncbi:efflux RND transporter periplasmic adaptor subunit [Candidatus Peregrinibacteria bacterium]|nr:efflux RND transporter periplasmic adaptor subunit [Candidatus Peregrinibacteria bacterium]